MSAYAQWFDPLGRCVCGKPATGVLRSYLGNGSLGNRCERCATKEIKAAHKQGQFEPDKVLEERRKRPATNQEDAG